MIPGFVVAVDQREKMPFEFTPSERVFLPTGDYSIIGLTDRIAIERKCPEELFKCAGPFRARFERELRRLATFEYAAIVIEGPLRSLLASRWSRVRPRSVINSLIAWSIRYGVHVWFADNRELARALTYRILQKFWFRVQGGRVRPTKPAAGSLA